MLLSQKQSRAGSAKEILSIWLPSLLDAAMQFVNIGVANYKINWFPTCPPRCD